MKNYLFLTTLLIYFQAFNLIGQVNNPADNNLFDSKTVHRIDVTINVDTLD